MFFFFFSFSLFSSYEILFLSSGVNEWNETPIYLVRERLVQPLFVGEVKEKEPKIDALDWTAKYQVEEKTSYRLPFPSFTL